MVMKLAVIGLAHEPNLLAVTMAFACALMNSSAHPNVVVIVIFSCPCRNAATVGGGDLDLEGTSMTPSCKTVPIELSDGGASHVSGASSSVSKLARRGEAFAATRGERGQREWVKSGYEGEREAEIEGALHASRRGYQHFSARQQRTLRASLVRSSAVRGVL